tara:strand:+ start:71 stop:406 length:336 start_codon:yes stop_codon:yes gene_type:complete
MNSDERICYVREIVDAINQSAGKHVLVISSKETQWQRGNGSIKRTDDLMDTLSINIRFDGYLVGCDGIKPGINDYLESTLPHHKTNSQNVRYQCSISQIKAVIEHYANVNP